MHLNIPIIVCFIGYAVLMLVVSLYWMRKIKKSTDFMVCGRGLPTWVLIGTLTATAVGTGVTVGAAGLAYKSGWAGTVYPIGMGVGAIIAGLFYAKMRNYKFMTMSEEIGCYYGGNKIVMESVNISLFISQIFWLTVQIMGAGYVISVVFGLPIKVSMVISGALVAMMCVSGGLLTVVLYRPHTGIYSYCRILSSYVLCLAWHGRRFRNACKNAAGICLFFG